jgi:hypothetical protein
MDSWTFPEMTATGAAARLDFSLKGWVGRRVDDLLGCPRAAFKSSLGQIRQWSGSRECAPDDRLRGAIQSDKESLDRFVARAPRDDVERPGSHRMRFARRPLNVIASSCEAIQMATETGSIASSQDKSRLTR